MNMGFPNVDILLQKMLKRKFEEMQADSTNFSINDLFDDMTTPEIASIVTYIKGKLFVTDLREREEDSVYIMPHYPLMDMPLPQIGISLGAEQPSERFLHDTIGDATKYTAGDGTEYWDVPKGYWASANYQIDVVATTKPETIWLARSIQRFLMEEQDSLAAGGILEINVTLADAKPAPEHQPMMVFNRSVQVSCKVANRWLKRIPAATYDPTRNTNLAIP